MVFDGVCQIKTIGKNFSFFSKPVDLLVPGLSKPIEIMFINISTRV